MEEQLGDLVILKNDFSAKNTYLKFDLIVS